jgi:hypothetical protein
MVRCWLRIFPHQDQGPKVNATQTTSHQKIDPNIIGAKLRHLVRQKYAPVAITFAPIARSCVDRTETPAAADCAYWKLAAEGKSFYTQGPDHCDCTIGAHTDGISLPSGKTDELRSLIGRVVELEFSAR